jgi:hypothetical protein
MGRISTARPLLARKTSAHVLSAAFISADTATSAEKTSESGSADIANWPSRSGFQLS